MMPLWTALTCCAEMRTARRRPPGHHLDRPLCGSLAGLEKRQFDAIKPFLPRPELSPRVKVMLARTMPQPARRGESSYTFGAI